MDPINKTALRAAVLIHEQLASGKRQDTPLYLPEYSWTNIQRLRRHIDLARRHGWHRAASRLNEDLANMLDNCRHELENTLRALKSRSTERPASSASDIYRDILALRDEFEELEIELDKHEISVTTDRIVLEDLNFGPFQIRLDWHSLGSTHAYRVVALDPHPAAKSDDVTHPHVQDEQLCEGEGRSAIRAALAECRLHDFFLLVCQLLHTYGRGSAYVELENWNGVPCDECGDSLNEDDRYYCHRCDATLCSSCSASCQGCGESHCSGCLSPCAACGYEYCSSCLATCPECHKRFCEDCCEEGLCLSCHQEQHNEEHEHDSSENARNEPVAPGA
jgi:hypothetical protein